MISETQSNIAYLEMQKIKFGKMLNSMPETSVLEKLPENEQLKIRDQIQMYSDQVVEIQSEINRLEAKIEIINDTAE